MLWVSSRSNDVGLNVNAPWRKFKVQNTYVMLYVCCGGYITEYSIQVALGLA